MARCYHQATSGNLKKALLHCICRGVLRGVRADFVLTVLIPNSKSTISERRICAILHVRQELGCILLARCRLCLLELLLLLRLLLRRVPLASLLPSARLVVNGAITPIAS